MFHPRNGVSPKPKTQDTSSRLRQNLVAREFEDRFNRLHLGRQIFQPLTVRGANQKVHQIEMNAARDMSDRQSVNRATASVMRNRGQQNAKVGQIEAALADSDGSLEDIGKAHLARASLLKENALKLNALGHAGQTTAETMFARNASRGAINGAILEEVHGVAALEGRTGLQARTGLKEEDLNSYIEKAGVGPLLDRHAMENDKSLKEAQSEQNLSPAEHWQSLYKSLPEKEFQAEVFKFRAQQIKHLYGDPGADRDTRVAYTSLRKLHLQANEDGLTSTASLKINQTLASRLPEDSEAREAMAAIRTITLDQRKAQKVADTAAR